MKYLVVAALVAALCWFGISRFNRADSPRAISAPPIVAPQLVVKVPAPVPLAKPDKATPPTPAFAPPVETVVSTPLAPAIPPPPVSSPLIVVPAWNPFPSPIIEPSKPVGPPAPLPQIAMADVLGENNFYHDDAFGVSAIYPEGWSIGGARRWGTNNSENTVGLIPPTPSTAQPSMYYQMYPNGYPELEGSEAYFRRVAQNKENTRIAGGMPDYKNLPGSFEFTEINGNPAVSYYAAYNRGDEVRAEFYVRILGKQGYVMFSVPGRMDDVQAIMPQLKQMAASVKVP
ncbi:MAG: hypothetical protein ABIZ81_00710 [Opitutaceae bacterium]